MEYRLLGNTGVKVSQLCMGTMTFGKEADRAASSSIFRRCREAGINFFDCANNYAGGEAEKILGELIQDCRREVIITTKVFNRVGADINARGTSRRHIMASVEESLRRLKTDYIDFYFLHHFDPDPDMEDSLRAMDDLVRQGKILYPAASNYAAWQIMKARAASKREGWSPIRCIEPMYNLVKRQSEVEILPMASSEQLGVITYGPLAGGLLTGKYLRENAGSTGRFKENEKYVKRYADAAIHETVKKFVQFAERNHYSPAALAVSWAGHHPAVTAPIIGARNINQLEESLKSLDVAMTDELYRLICDLSVVPPSATNR
ncbi:MAG: aldo/keto reductase [Deltaproteobacteria bacterium]|nr:aldo/keto reductase [Deltaproteobacteria bacterium]